ncbi:MAG: tyrosine-type recombinase/integrase, partial [Corallincola sp.]|nr:tyrosine-type recombinase/integrase [Corallincola sp.]
MRVRHWRDQLIARVMAGGAPTTGELGLALAVITAMPLARSLAVVAALAPVHQGDMPFVYAAGLCWLPLISPDQHRVNGASKDVREWRFHPDAVSALLIRGWARHPSPDPVPTLAQLQAQGAEIAGPQWLAAVVRLCQVSVPDLTEIDRLVLTDWGLTIGPAHAAWQALLRPTMRAASDQAIPSGDAPVPIQPRATTADELTIRLRRLVTDLHQLNRPERVRALNDLADAAEGHEGLALLARWLAVKADDCAPGTIRRYAAELIGTWCHATCTDVADGAPEAINRWIEQGYAARPADSQRVHRQATFMLIRCIQAQGVGGGLCPQLGQGVPPQVAHADLICEPTFQRAMALLAQTLSCEALTQHLLVALLGYRCGMRIREIVGLRLDDTADDHLQIRSHRRRSLKSPAARRKLPVEILLTADELALWQAYRQKARKEGQQYLFMASGNEVTQAAGRYSTLITQALRAASGLPAVSFHSLRHAAATTVFAALYDLPPLMGSPLDPAVLRTTLLGQSSPSIRRAPAALAQLMGHRSISTTLKFYIHLFELRARQLAGRSVPLSSATAQALLGTNHQGLAHRTGKSADYTADDLASAVADLLGPWAKPLPMPPGRPLGPRWMNERY